MNKIFAALFASAFLATSALAQQAVVQQIPTRNQAGSPTYTPVQGCTRSAIYDAGTSGNTELVALSSGKTVYICGYTILAAGTVNVKLVTGTGTACATGTANLTPAFQLVAQAGAVDGSPFFRGLKGAASSAVCINASGAIPVQAIIYYLQY